MTFKCFAETAPYLQTILSHKRYVEKARVLSPWVPIGWQLENTPHDWLHVCYLGTGPGHVALTLKMLQVLGYGFQSGESDDMFLRRTSLEMRQTCKQFGRSDRMNLTMLDLAFGFSF